MYQCPRRRNVPYSSEITLMRFATLTITNTISAMKMPLNTQPPTPAAVSPASFPMPRKIPVITAIRAPTFR